MPPGSQRYTLRNFSDELDWRPLHFVDSLPPARVCSACGLVVKLTGSLPCGHFLCGPCYQQQRELGGAQCCPFDGEACPEESVHWREFPAENLLERQVYCWNEANGCNVILAASNLSRHFSQECKHHLVCCPKCFTKIIYPSLCSHLRSCTGSQGPGMTESACRASDTNQQTTELTALKAMLSTATRQMEQQLGDLKGWLERLSLEGNLQTEQVNALSHTMNDLKETLQHDLETVASQTRNGIARHTADIGAVKNRLPERGRETFEKINLVLHHTLRAQSTHNWILKGYRALKAKARRLGSADRYCSPVYLCHYFLSQGVCFEMDGEDMLLSMKICLKKGEVDEYLQWPFKKRMVLSIVHPETYIRKEIQLLSELGDDRYSRPTASCNQIVHSSDCLYLCDLERDGYLKGNELELSFALA